MSNVLQLLKQAATAKKLEANKLRDEAQALLEKADAIEEEARVLTVGAEAILEATGSAKPTKKKAAKKASNKTEAAPKQAAKAKAKPAKTKSAKAKAAAEAPAKAGAKGKAKKPLSGVNLNISKSRKAVAEGKVPKLQDRIIQVMGDKECSIKEVVALLEEKDWITGSKNPAQYVNYMLSIDKDVFEKVSRGIYKVKAPKAKVTANKTNGVSNKGKAKAAPITAAKSEEPQMTPAEIEVELEDLGSNVAENPFM